MSLNTYPETPAQEAARINAASGDPDGITAEQVANNRSLNRSLTASFGTARPQGSNQPSGSLPINPIANAVALAGQILGSGSDAAGNLASTKVNIGAANLNQSVDRLSGAINSGSSLGGFSAGSAAGFNANTALRGIGGTIENTITGVAGTLQETAGAIANVTADIASSINRLGAGDLTSGVSNLLGGIASAAGQINNLLSLRRGVNIPSGAELFKQTGQAIQVRPSNGNDWRVRVNAEWTLFDSPMFALLEQTGGVVWPYLPNITFSTKANYTQIEPVHNNYPFQAYKNSQVDEIQIGGEFSCETETDAAYWIAATTFFKTATKMFFGQGDNVGNPPIICILSGYGTSIFNNVPVVVKSFSVDLKDDVNYVNCNTFGTNTWVPVLSTISITVSPIYNRSRLRQFNLRDYASGGMTSGIGFI